MLQKLERDVRAEDTHIGDLHYVEHFLVFKDWSKTYMVLKGKPYHVLTLYKDRKVPILYVYVLQLIH